MLICEYFWHISPPYLLWLDGADMLLMHSASPSRGLDAGDRLVSSRWVEQTNQAYGAFLTNYVVHCNRVGWEDGKNFAGGSSVVDPNGEFVTHGHYFDEKLITAAIDLNQVTRSRARLPLLRDEQPSSSSVSWRVSYPRQEKTHDETHPHRKAPPPQALIRRRSRPKASSTPPVSSAPIRRPVSSREAPSKNKRVRCSLISPLCLKRRAARSPMSSKRPCSSAI